MRGDPGYHRYFAYLNLFMTFMLLLVLGDNLLLMFIGWEGVGLCSYLLIGFWYEDDANCAAGRKAFIMNRIGDFAFLLGIFLCLTHFGTLAMSALTDVNQIQTVAAQTLTIPLLGSVGLVTTIVMLLFIGATGKSAQIPLYVWLPDAMAGPTPVSALIHAATMVTSGVYLCCRLMPLFQAAPAALTIIAGIGACTALLAALIAFGQNDIKKVLAYSTVSQLGYMFFAIGVGAFSAAFFHVVTHAFFKALLFLGSGSVIHAMHHQQDMRKMGGLRKQLPFTHLTFLVGTLAIAGVPPLAGFFSKDEILFAGFEQGFLAGSGAAMLFWGI
jgi:NADH-quinone oxidoreductase subunit L